MEGEEDLAGVFRTLGQEQRHAPSGLEPAHDAGQGALEDLDDLVGIPFPPGLQISRHDEIAVEGAAHGERRHK